MKTLHIKTATCDSHIICGEGAFQSEIPSLCEGLTFTVTYLTISFQRAAPYMSFPQEKRAKIIMYC